MRIAKFIGLKIIEISGTLGIFYLSSLYYDLLFTLLYSGSMLTRMLEHHWFIRGFIGFLLVILTLAVPTLIVIGIYLLVLKNWEWAGKK